MIKKDESKDKIRNNDKIDNKVEGEDEIRITFLHSKWISWTVIRAFRILKVDPLVNY